MTTKRRAWQLAQYRVTDHSSRRRFRHQKRKSYSRIDGPNYAARYHRSDMEFVKSEHLRFDLQPTIEGDTLQLVAFLDGKPAEGIEIYRFQSWVRQVEYSAEVVCRLSSGQATTPYFLTRRLASHFAPWRLGVSQDVD